MGNPQEAGKHDSTSAIGRYLTTRRQFTELLRDLWGISQQTADEQIDSVLGAIGIWIEGAVKGLPENCESRLLVSGFGSFRVNVKRRGRRNAQRIATGLVSPPPVTVRVAFRPCESILKAVRKSNLELNKQLPSNSFYFA